MSEKRQVVVILVPSIMKDMDQDGCDSSNIISFEVGDEGKCNIHGDFLIIENSKGEQVAIFNLDKITGWYYFDPKQNKNTELRTERSEVPFNEFEGWEFICFACGERLGIEVNPFSKIVSISTHDHVHNCPYLLSKE